jgi:hypothetical protein
MANDSTTTKRMTTWAAGEAGTGRLGWKMEDGSGNGRWA